MSGRFGSNDSEVSEETAQRLGRAQLGRFAHEKRMPLWLKVMLRKKRYVEQQGVIGVLGQLLEKDLSTQTAYLCDDSVTHISKLKWEGGFCGYRNVQMLFSYVIGVSDLGTEWYGKAIPSIFEIQDYIEEAWNKGYNSKGRAETGGIKDTRKYIGTPEVQATFSSLEIPSSVQRFQSCEQSSAAVQLLAATQAYFQQDTLALGSSKLRLTTLPPIYLQQPGHSMTIVGMQTLEDGQCKLLVFDPTYQNSDAIVAMRQRPKTRIRSSSAAQLLSAYCRDATYLEKYSEFELF